MGPNGSRSREDYRQCNAFVRHSLAFQRHIHTNWQPWAWACQATRALWPSHGGFAAQAPQQGTLGPAQWWQQLVVVIVAAAAVTVVVVVVVIVLRGALFFIIWPSSLSYATVARFSFLAIANWPQVRCSCRCMSSSALIGGASGASFRRESAGVSCGGRCHATIPSKRARFNQTTTNAHREALTS